MTPQERATQLRVGIFMAIGLSAVAAMVVYFGRLGDAVRDYYQIRVEYPNASGLLKGASVLLAGAKVGFVEDSPVILPDMDGVYVMLKIYADVKIPVVSEFTVGSSGLLGDRFVQVNLKGSAHGQSIEPGAVIKGKSESGMSDIFDQAGPFIGEVRDTVKKINSIAAKLDSEVFKESTIKDLNDTIANLKTTSASFTEASKKLDTVMQKAEGVLGTGDQAMVSAKAAADELKKAIVDIRSLLAQAKQGRGALGVLLSDKQTADNIRALVKNLRERGILFYKNRDGAPNSQ